MEQSQKRQWTERTVSATALTQVPTNWLGLHRLLKPYRTIGTAHVRGEGITILAAHEKVFGEGFSRHGGYQP